MRMPRMHQSCVLMSFPSPGAISTSSGGHLSCHVLAMRLQGFMRFCDTSFCGFESRVKLDVFSTPLAAKLQAVLAPRSIQEPTEALASGEETSRGYGAVPSCPNKGCTVNNPSSARRHCLPAAAASASLAWVCHAPAELWPVPKNQNHELIQFILRP